ncbi:MAG: MarR family winged helix-turn-helix transcriptional regulator [Terriglobales bacterium]
MRNTPASHPSDLLPLVVADVYELTGALRQHGERLAARVGQTQARWQLLRAASAEPARSVAQLARRLGTARQGVQRLADVLVREGAAVYRANPDHRRSPLLVPTPAGERALAQITAAAQRFHNRLEAALPRRVAAELHAGLRALLAALNTLPAEERS